MPSDSTVSASTSSENTSSNTGKRDTGKQYRYKRTVWWKIIQFLGNRISKISNSS